MPAGPLKEANLGYGTTWPFAPVPDPMRYATPGGNFDGATTRVWPVFQLFHVLFISSSPHSSLHEKVPADWLRREEGFFDLIQLNWLKATSAQREDLHNGLLTNYLGSSLIEP